MTRPANLHEVVRSAVDAVLRGGRETVVDLEHRGDGDAELDALSLDAAVTAILRHVLRVLQGTGESVWMRSSGTDPATLVVTARWRGPAAGAELVAHLGAALSPGGGAVQGGVDGDDAFLRLELPRLPPAG